MADLVLKQGEAKTITFTVTDTISEVAIDLTGATLAFSMRRRNDTTALVSKADASFGKSQEALGIVTVFFTATDTTQTPGMYVGELKINFAGSPVAIDKSTDLDIEIQRATTS